MKLEKKIHALNEINRVGKIIIDALMPQLEKYVGQKIFLANGDTSSKFNIEYPKVELVEYLGVEYARLQRCYVRKTYKSVYLSISCTFKRDEASCFYEELEIWVGDLDDNGQVLQNLRTEPYEFKNYDVVEIRALLKEKEVIQDRLDTIKSKVRKFSDGYYE